MTGDQSNYHRLLRNLNVQVREMAIQLMHSLLDEGYDENHAVSIAVEQAKKWADASSNDFKPITAPLHVIPHPDGWAVRRANAKKANFVFNSRSEARDKALQMSRKEQGNVFLHRSDGQIEGRYVF